MEYYNWITGQYFIIYICFGTFMTITLFKSPHENMIQPSWSWQGFQTAVYGATSITVIFPTPSAGDRLALLGYDVQLNKTIYNIGGTRTIRSTLNILAAVTRLEPKPACIRLSLLMSEIQTSLYLYPMLCHTITILQYIDIPQGRKGQTIDTCLSKIFSEKSVSHRRNVGYTALLRVKYSL